MLVEGRSIDILGNANEVLELWKDVRRLLILNIRRTPEGFLRSCCGGGGESKVAGEEILRSISVSLTTMSMSLSVSEEGYAPGIFRSGVLGWEVRGPPCDVGGSLLIGVCGDGSIVPAVREKSTGVRVISVGGL